MGVVGGFLNFRVGSVAEASLGQVDPSALAGLCGNLFGHRHSQWAGQYEHSVAAFAVVFGCQDQDSLSAHMGFG